VQAAGFRELREVVLARTRGPEFREVISRVLALERALDERGAVMGTKQRCR
jgi:hypothetical protein